MSYNVLTIPPFDRQLKRLVKKFPSLKTEYAQLIESLETEPVQGSAMSNSCYKIRVALKSKGKGKSGGTRVIVHVQVIESNVFLLAIYDKSEQEDITDKEIKYLLSFID
ncbi:MAG: type II toxin-antitoxin system RelE/ParE family toxin [Bacteroidota bacterium]|nr:type II toxin-antitoxin system RelE/ParE family toxin [Bacteroidota bacterium]